MYFDFKLIFFWYSNQFFEVFVIKYEILWSIVVKLKDKKKYQDLNINSGFFEIICFVVKFYDNYFVIFFLFIVIKLWSFGSNNVIDI